MSTKLAAPTVLKTIFERKTEEVAERRKRCSISELELAAQLGSVCPRCKAASSTELEEKSRRGRLACYADEGAWRKGETPSIRISMRRFFERLSSLGEPSGLRCGRMGSVWALPNTCMRSEGCARHNSTRAPALGYS